MRRSPWQRLLYGCSLACAAVPFGFGLIRLFQTGSDFRFLWMALVSFLSASAVLAIGQPDRRRPLLRLLVAAAAFAAAVLLGGATAFMLGASSGLAVWVVAFGFGLCWAASHTFKFLSTPGPL